MRPHWRGPRLLGRLTQPAMRGRSEERGGIGRCAHACESSMDMTRQRSYPDCVLALDLVSPLVSQDSEQARPSKALQYSRWEDSLEVLLAALQTHAPVDGLLGTVQLPSICCTTRCRTVAMPRSQRCMPRLPAGFSQGATATALLLSELASRADVADPLMFAIMVCTCYKACLGRMSQTCSAAWTPGFLLAASSSTWVLSGLIDSRIQAKRRGGGEQNRCGEACDAVAVRVGRRRSAGAAGAQPAADGLFRRPDGKLRAPGRAHGAAALRSCKGA
jgi:hypothetical protein